METTPLKTEQADEAVALAFVGLLEAGKPAAANRLLSGYVSGSVRDSRRAASSSRRSAFRTREGAQVAAEKRKGYGRRGSDSGAEKSGSGI